MGNTIAVVVAAMMFAAGHGSSPSPATRAGHAEPSASPVSVVAAAKPPANSSARKAAPAVKFSDKRAGFLRNYRKVPCGGLWEYRFSGVPAGKTYYAREIVCPGSAAYLTLRTGDKVLISGKAYRVTSTQVLNYRTGSTADIRWTGDIAVQTCYPNGKGKVRTVHLKRI